MPNGLRIDQVRGLEALARRSEMAAQEPINQPSSIEPDDATSIGSAPRWAREDHQHQNLAAAPAALTRVSSSTEGSAGSFARSDHVHSTAQLAWGVIARQTLTTTFAAVSADATTDFALASVAVLDTRLYEVGVRTEYVIGGTFPAEWDLNFHVGGTLTQKMATLRETTNAARHTLTTTFLWEPATGTVNLDLRLDEIGGTATVEFTSGVATNRRQFWVSDVGPRA